MGAPDDEREVRVAAKGPTDVDFERTGSAEHGALFTLAGCYLVRATLGGRLLSGARRQPLGDRAGAKFTCGAALWPSRAMRASPVFPQAPARVHWNPPGWGYSRNSTQMGT